MACFDFKEWAVSSAILAMVSNRTKYFTSVKWPQECGKVKEKRENLTFELICFSYDRNIANGEILGIHLLLEDILMLFNDEDEKIFTASEPLLILSKKEEKEEEIDLLGEKPLVEEQVPPKPVNEDIIVFTLNESISNPLKQFSLALVNYAKIYNFLITWKRLEVLKLDWIRRKTLIDAVNDPNVYAKSM